jgi:hypothetical protein
LLEVERVSHNSGLSGDSIQRVVQPTETEDGKTWIMHTAGLPNAGRAWLMLSRIE